MFVPSSWKKDIKANKEPEQQYSTGIPLEIDPRRSSIDEKLLHNTDALFLLSIQSLIHTRPDEEEVLGTNSTNTNNDMSLTEHQAESKPRFPTILAARGNDGRPSDLEFMLRPHCQKLRVVEKISGAHLMFPSESSLAVRVYFSCDLEDLLLRKKKDKDHDNDNDDDDGDFDNLSSFLKTFRLALVLFILPQNKQRQEQLDNPSSYFHRAQRIVRSMTLQNAGNDSSDAVDKTLRVYLLPNTETAIYTLISTADAMKKKNAKHAYFEKQRERFFLPTSSITSTNTIPMACAPAAAVHVAEALREWAHRFDLPPGEANVLMSLLGTLGDIVTADDHVLESVPIDDRTKRLLHVFFGSSANDTQMTTATVTSYYNQHDDACDSTTTPPPRNYSSSQLHPPSLAIISGGSSYYAPESAFVSLPPPIAIARHPSSYHTTPDSAAVVVLPPPIALRHPSYHTPPPPPPPPPPPVVEMVPMPVPQQVRGSHHQPMLYPPPQYHPFSYEIPSSSAPMMIAHPHHRIMATGGSHGTGSGMEQPSSAHHPQQYLYGGGDHNHNFRSPHSQVAPSQFMRRKASPLPVRSRED